MASSSSAAGAGSGSGAAASASAPHVLTLRRMLGINGNVSQAVHYVEENRLVYVCGSNVVLYNTEKKAQQMLSTLAPPPAAAAPSAPPAAGGADAAAAGSASAAAASSSASAAASSVSSGDISAMAVCHLTSGGASSKHGAGVDGQASRPKSKLLAVAERGDPGRAFASVFSLSTHKKLNKAPLGSPEVASGEIVCMAFSPDGKSLLLQGGAPDWTLTNIAWEKGKILQMAKVSNQSGAIIHAVSFCPTDPSVVCVTGNGILRFLHLEQGEFKSIPFSMGKREPQNYLSHCWIDDRILVGTESGDILVFENAEFRGVLESSPAGGKSIDCIVAYSKGFVLGMDEGYVMVFERDDKEIYKYARSFQIDGNFVKIRSLAISPSEEHVVCTLENNQAYMLGLSSHHGSGDSLRLEDLSFEPLVAWHHMAITGMDVCIRKPLVVTCGADRSVRIYNLQHDTVEVTRFFNEQPHSCALHPQGLLLLVGFSDALRLLNILIDDVAPFRDFAIKGCKECQFSNGGQYFAAANGSVIQVFATYTCEMLGSFNVHKAKVRSIAWSHDDSAIISAGMDGCVFHTKIATGEHVALAKHKCNYTCAVSTSEGKVYAAGSDRHLKVISDGALQAELNCGTVLTQLCTQPPRMGLKDRFLYAGMETGGVRVFPIPVEGKCYDQQVHTGAITRVRATADDLWLITASEDGSLAIFAVEAKRDAAGGGGAGGRARGAAGNSSSDQMAMSEEVLASAEELRERYAMVSDMQAQVSELKERIDQTLRLKDAAFKDKLRETSERFNAELEGDKQRYSALEEAKISLENSYAHKVEQLNALHRAKMRELQEHHDHKMLQEEERRTEFESRIKDQRARCEIELQEVDERCIAEKNALADEYEAKIAEARALKVKLLLEREAVRADMSEQTLAMENDADAEIDEIKAAYDRKLHAERLHTLHLKDENSIQKRKFGNVREDITENLDDLQRMRDKHASLYEQIDTLEKDIKGHVKEIREREATISDKRYRIFELQKKNQELEKFKFVLDYKIAELKRQIAPRKSEMSSLSTQISEMERELRGYKKESADLKLDVQELHLKGEGMDGAILRETKAREEIVATLSHVKAELHEVFSEIENPKKLKDGIIRLYQRHVQNANQQQQEKSTSKAAKGGKEKDDESKSAASGAAGASASNSVDDVHSDYQRQRHYLERSIDSHNAKCKKDMRVHVKEHTRIMQENIALTKEVNELRREKYHILLNQKAKDQAKQTKPSPGASSAGSPATGAISTRLSRTLGASGDSAGVLPSIAGASSSSSGVDDTEIQQEQIRALKKQLAMLEGEYSELVAGGVAPAAAASFSAATGQMMNPSPPGSSSARSSGLAGVMGSASTLSARGLHESSGGNGGSSTKLPLLPGSARKSASGGESQRSLAGAGAAQEDAAGDDLDEVNASLQQFSVESKEAEEESKQ